MYVVDCLAQRHKLLLWDVEIARVPFGYFEGACLNYELT